MEKIKIMLVLVLVLVGAFFACENPSGTDGESRYRVIIAPLENGAIKVEPVTALSGAAVGTVVTVTVMPNFGYRVKEGSLTVNGEALLGTSWTLDKTSAVRAEFEAGAVQSISSADDLLKIGKELAWPLNGIYKLEQDVDVGGIAEWTPIGAALNGDTEDYAGRGFSGSFDGNGYKIENLHLAGGGAFVTGLFGLTSGAHVENLTITLADGTDITLSGTGDQYIGAAAAYARSSEFTNITVEGGDFKIAKTSGTLYAGGAVGYGTDTAFGNLVFDGASFEVSGATVYAGGITGYAVNYSSISGSHADKPVKVTGVDKLYAGGVAGYAMTASITGTYSTGGVETVYNGGTASISYGYTGGVVGYADSASISNSYSERDIAISGEGVSGGQSINNGLYTGGVVGYAVNSSINECHYETPAGTGGVSTSISAGASVLHAGGIAGGVSDTAIHDSWSDGTVKGSRSGTVSYAPIYVGGIVGRALTASPINDCHTSKAVSGERTDTTISATAVASTIYVGGIAGASSANISRCYALGTVTVDLPASPVHPHSAIYAGGITGRFSAAGCEISECYSTGAITGKNLSTHASAVAAVHVGGIVGSGLGTITINKCYATGDITAETANVVTSANNTTNVNANAAAAGIAGYTIASTAGKVVTIENCASLSDTITAQAKTAVYGNVARIGLQQKISGNNHTATNNIAVVPSTYTVTYGASPTTETPAVTSAKAASTTTTTPAAINGETRPVATISALSADDFFGPVTAAAGEAAEGVVTSGLGWDSGVWVWNSAGLASTPLRPLRFAWEDTN